MSARHETLCAIASIVDGEFMFDGSGSVQFACPKHGAEAASVKEQNGQFVVRMQAGVFV
jgi:hypothetical protein